MARESPPIVRIDEELGLVRYCLGCEEWWPSDEDFWRPNRWYRRAVCRACHSESRRENEAEARRREQTAAAARKYRAKLREGQVA